MRGVVAGTGKRLEEVGQRLATLLTRLFTSRELQESKARLEEAQRVAHVGYWVWGLDTFAVWPTRALFRHCRMRWLFSTTFRGSRRARGLRGPWPAAWMRVKDGPPAGR
jgi:hypothetical protein